MTCAVFASCGNSDDSSSKSSSSKSSSSSASSASGDNSAASDSKSGTYTDAYTEILQSKHFSLDVTITSPDYDSEAGMVLEFCDSDYHMSISDEEMSIEMYLIGEKMYLLDSTTKSYSVMDYSAELYGEEDPTASGFGIQEGYEFVGSEETEDGLICETYEAAVDDMYDFDTDSADESAAEEETEKDIYKYYFNKETGDLVKLVATQYGVDTVVTVNSFSTDITEIALPDLTDWTEESYGTEVSDGEELTEEDFLAEEEELTDEEVLTEEESAAE